MSDKAGGRAAPVVLRDEDMARVWIREALSADDSRMAQLDDFAARLVEANRDQNLIAASTVPHLWVRHIADSAQLLCHDRAEPDGLWLDLGSGPGLPGLVVAILTDRPVWLVESRRRRCGFLNEIVAALGLGGRVRVCETPLERLESVEAATISARAFAPLDRLIALSTRFSTSETRWLLPKGRNAVKELAMLHPAWQRLFHVEQSITDPDSAVLVGHGRAMPSARGQS